MQSGRNGLEKATAGTIFACAVGGSCALPATRLATSAMGKFRAVLIPLVIIGLNSTARAGFIGSRTEAMEKAVPLDGSSSTSRRRM
jgi:hypothetical protein